jgi:hypothetical protein
VPARRVDSLFEVYGFLFWFGSPAQCCYDVCDSNYGNIRELEPSRPEPDLTSLHTADHAPEQRGQLWRADHARYQKQCAQSGSRRATAPGLKPT